MPTGKVVPERALPVQEPAGVRFLSGDVRGVMRARKNSGAAQLGIEFTGNPDARGWLQDRIDCCSEASARLKECQAMMQRVSDFYRDRAYNLHINSKRS